MGGAVETRRRGSRPNPPKSFPKTRPAVDVEVLAAVLHGGARFRDGAAALMGAEVCRRAAWDGAVGRLGGVASTLLKAAGAVL